MDPISLRFVLTADVIVAILLDVPIPIPPTVELLPPLVKPYVVADAGPPLLPVVLLLSMCVRMSLVYLSLFVISALLDSRA